MLQTTLKWNGWNDDVKSMKVRYSCHLPQYNHWVACTPHSSHCNRSGGWGLVPVARQRQERA